MFVSKCVTVMVALGTAEPLASVIVPVKAPRSPWPNRITLIRNPALTRRFINPSTTNPGGEPAFSRHPTVEQRSPQKCGLAGRKRRPHGYGRSVLEFHTELNRAWLVALQADRAEAARVPVGAAGDSRVAEDDAVGDVAALRLKAQPVAFVEGRHLEHTDVLH